MTHRTMSEHSYHGATSRSKFPLSLKRSQQKVTALWLVSRSYLNATVIIVSGTLMHSRHRNRRYLRQS